MKDNVKERIFDRIAADISDRRGLKQEWAAIDPEIMEEIRAEWFKIFDEEIGKYILSGI